MELEFVTLKYCSRLAPLLPVVVPSPSRIEDEYPVGTIGKPHIGSIPPFITVNNAPVVVFFVTGVYRGVGSLTLISATVPEVPNHEVVPELYDKLEQGPTNGASVGLVIHKPNVPLLLFPFSHMRIKIVSPGVNPVCVNIGILPDPELASQLRGIKLVQDPLYVAIPASNTVISFVSIVISPLKGTTVLNHTSPPK